MSLVTYDSSVTINFSLMKMDKPNKGRAKAFVELIKEGTCTNLSGGLLKGVLLQQMHQTSNLCIVSLSVPEEVRHASRAPQLINNPCLSANNLTGICA